MTNSETPDAGTQMDDSGGVSGTVNLMISLPEGTEISTVDTSPPAAPPAAVGSAVIPGTIVPYAGSSEPSDGWLICDGRSVEQAEYSALFQIIGTTYGSGSGSTTFSLPDLRGRFPLGLDNMGRGSANVVTATKADELGGVAGSEDHTLSVAEMPRHRHEPDQNDDNERRFSVIEGGGGRFYHHTSSHSHTGIIGNERYTEYTGGGGSHNNMPPYMSLNYLIKT